MCTPPKPATSAGAATNSRRGRRRQGEPRGRCLKRKGWSYSFSSAPSQPPTCSPLSLFPWSSLSATLSEAVPVGAFCTYPTTILLTHPSQPPRFSPRIQVPLLFPCDHFCFQARLTSASSLDAAGYGSLTQSPVHCTCQCTCTPTRVPVETSRKPRSTLVLYMFMYRPQSPTHAKWE